MKPLYISVDLKVTTPGNLILGRIMQAGMITSELEELRVTFPVKTDAYLSLSHDPALAEGLSPLLKECKKIYKDEDSLGYRVLAGRKIPLNFFSRMSKLYDWVTKVCHAADSRRNAVLVGDAMTSSFLSLAFSRAGLDNPFGDRVLDLKSLAMGRYDLGFEADFLLRLLRTSSLDGTKRHDALWSARQNLLALNGLVQGLDLRSEELLKRLELPAKAS